MGLYKLINTFYNLFSGSLGSISTINDEDLQSLKQFVALLYDRTSNSGNLIECRHELFTKKR